MAERIPTTPPAKGCRKYAGLYSELAQAAADPVEKGILMQIATQFRRLANRKDKQKPSQVSENSN